jgi:hypothetical protein
LERGGVYHTGNEGLEEGDEAEVGCSLTLVALMAE